MSGLPYLKISAVEQYKMHLILLHFGPLIEWYLQNFWKVTWPLYWTVSVAAALICYKCY